MATACYRGRWQFERVPLRWRHETRLRRNRNSAYTSGIAERPGWTEAWVSAWAYCPHCGNAKISSFPNNSPLADFFCTSCSEEFELKSQKGKFGTQGCRRRVQDEMRTSGREQQSQPLADELRPQVARGRQSVHRAEAFLRPRHHRGTKAAGRDRATRRLDRIEHPARAAFPSPAKFTSSRAASFVRRTSSLRNGRRRCSSETNRWRRAAGCSTS